jgi:alcohol dehydrogenase class IV
MLPRVALVDPELSLSVPPSVTAATGLDALTQLIEPYTSRRAQPLIDALALDAIRRAGRALPRVYEHPEDLEARSEMMLASLVSGIALAHAGLGAAHALAGPMGGSFPVPHGFACAAVLPHAMAANILRARGETLRRYADVARALGVDAEQSDRDAAQAGIEVVRGLCKKLGVPGLATFGVTPDALADLAARAQLTSSMKANPVDLSDADLREILAQAL